MLLDSASLYFRAFYGVPDTITASDGTPVNAIRGFTDMVARLVTERRPSRLVACLDLDWRPAFRVAALPSYKAHRVPGRPDTAPAGIPEVVPAELVPQVPVLLELLAAVGHRDRGRRRLRGRRRDRHAGRDRDGPTRCWRSAATGI